jgi:ADP-heptose:LPS heptosyltransferase
MPVLKDYCDTDNHPPCEVYVAPKDWGKNEHTLDACKAMLPLLEAQYYIKKADIYNKDEFKKKGWKIDKDLKKVWWMKEIRTKYRKAKYAERTEKYGPHCHKTDQNTNPWCDCGFEDVMNDPLQNLCYNIIYEFGKPFSIADDPWIEVPDPKKVAPIVIARSNRYKNYRFPWKTLWQRFKHKSVYIGLRHEWKLFCERVEDKVPYYPTSNFLEIAQVIAGSKLFIGNQSAPYAVAEGMKHDTIQETSPRIPSIYFNRPNARYYLRRWYPCCACGDPQCPWNCQKLHL